MATNLNVLSDLLTDPVRNFKFLVQFSPVAPDGLTPDTYWKNSSRCVKCIWYYGLRISFRSKRSDRVNCLP